MRYLSIGLCVSAILAAGNLAAQEPTLAESYPAEEVVESLPAETGHVEIPHGQFAYPYDGSWHAGYKQTWWGRPVALVVPPTAHYQTIWGWGVGATQIEPIQPQFEGPMNGYPHTVTGDWLPTPYWPTDTRQFGVYYIRGPWQ